MDRELCANFSSFAVVDVDVRLRRQRPTPSCASGLNRWQIFIELILTDNFLHIILQGGHSPKFNHNLLHMFGYIRVLKIPRKGCWQVILWHYPLVVGLHGTKLEGKNVLTFCDMPLWYNTPQRPNQIFKSPLIKISPNFLLTEASLKSHEAFWKGGAREGLYFHNLKNARIYYFAKEVRKLQPLIFLLFHHFAREREFPNFDALQLFYVK